MGTHPIFESDFDCLTGPDKEMSAQLLNDINERLAKMPYLGGYEMSKEDKETLSKIEQPPLQHVNALRWYNQCRHETGVTSSNNSDCTSSCPVEAAPVDKIGAAYSKVVDPALLPAMKAQRDPKTGQLKD